MVSPSRRRRLLAAIFMLILIALATSFLNFRNQSAATELERYEEAREYDIPDWWIYESGELEIWFVSGTSTIIFEAWDERDPRRDPTDAPWLWRITAYDAYTGFGWKKTNQTFYEPTLRVDRWRPRLRVRIYVKVRYEELWGREVQLNLPVPVGGKVVSINMRHGILYQEKLFVDPYDDYIFFIRIYPREIEYSVQWSDTPIIDARSPLILDRNSTIWKRPELMAGRLSEVPAWIISTYTQLPSNLPSIVWETAERLKVPDASIYEQALVVAAFLYSEFEYNRTLTEPRPGEDLVAYFLRERRGVCRHFATAFAVLLRCLGVPVRVVIGPSRVYIDEQSHRLVGATPLGAWNEVYIPNVGWVTFIAGRAPDSYWEGSGLMRSGRQNEQTSLNYGAWEVLIETGEIFFEPKVRWMRMPSPVRVSKVNPPSPARITPPSAGGLPKGLSLGYPLLVMLLTVILLILASYAPWFVRSVTRLEMPSLNLRLRSRKGPSVVKVTPSEALALAREGRYREAVAACYRCLLYFLYRYRGILKEEWMTPREFGDGLAPSLGPKCRDLESLTSLYEEAHFSPHEVGVEGFSKAYSSLEGLIEWVRRG
ncbi:MAG: hypothetical protein AYL31_001880 [Candidatus Bathyarchaeota archaeon B26-1]|nr:MAG: hypothetical protein AYL31_001880 [Candidatus Bathyarchaeota archaeon B26-1]